MPINPLSMIQGRNARGEDGSTYQTQGGLADKIWGQRNINMARFNEAVARIQSRGLPGTSGLGFKTTQLGQPNATWDGFKGLMLGLPGRVGAYGNAPSQDTRFDGDQVGIKTNDTLTQDTYAGRPDLQVPLYRLRQMAGLK